MLKTLLAISMTMMAELATGCGDGAVAVDPPDLEVFRAGQVQYPGATWVPAERPDDWGWSGEGLRDARSFFDGLESTAVMVIHRGVLMASWGDVEARYNGQSIRKSLLGALIGLEAAENRLSLEATLEDLGIDDSSSPLTEAEKTAQVKDLLQTTGGIYLPAVYEAPSWKRRKPERGSTRPGEAWFYSNWGFNALGTIFEESSGSSIHEAFGSRIAEPLAMEDYRHKDVQYLSRDDVTEKMMKNDSEHRAYVFMISTRDLARFGLLYLNHGRWNERQIVPEDWVEKSTVGDTVATHEYFGGDRYGYLWWRSPRESRLGEMIGASSFRASGGRGHKLVIIPDLDLVVVHRLKTGGVGLLSQVRRRVLGAPSVDDRDIGKLLQRIVAAHPERRNSPSS